MLDKLPDGATESDTERNGFLSYAAEFHAITHGVYDGLTSRRLRAQELPDNKDVDKEPHYYKGGFVIGTLLQVALVGGVIHFGL